MLMFQFLDLLQGMHKLLNETKNSKFWDILFQICAI